MARLEERVIKRQPWTKSKPSIICLHVFLIFIITHTLTITYLASNLIDCALALWLGIHTLESESKAQGLIYNLEIEIYSISIQ